MQHNPNVLFAGAGRGSMMEGSEPAHRLPQPASTRVAILNGFGRALGDGIIGLQALSVAMTTGAVPSRPVLFRLPGLPPMVQALHAAAEFADIETLPWDFATTERRYAAAERFGSVIDIRDFAFDPEFRRRPMIDFFLQRLGVEPRSVPASLRRNTWLAPRVPRHRLQLPDGYILVCPRASTPLRNMPDAVHARILRTMLELDRPVVTQGSVPIELAADVIHAPPCDTLAELAALVRNACWMVSTDTAMVHLADAFDVPCLAFFPTHRPDSRVRDYPRCVSVALASALPMGIEFARDVADYALAHSAWFPHGAEFQWLERLIVSALETLLP
jgi:glycosyl transferase family 9 (putative heptosyltransferase)